MPRDIKLTAIMNGLDRFTEKGIRSLALDIYSNLVETTPVDTGWARANWVPSVGIPKAPGAAKAKDKEAQIPGKRADQEAGQASILGYSFHQGKIYISNNVPYIGRLNFGSSKQAPSGFVQQAITRAIRNIGR